MVYQLPSFGFDDYEWPDICRPDTLEDEVAELTFIPKDPPTDIVICFDGDQAGHLVRKFKAHRDVISRSSAYKALWQEATERAGTDRTVYLKPESREHDLITIKWLYTGVIDPTLTNNGHFYVLLELRGVAVHGPDSHDLPDLHAQLTSIVGSYKYDENEDGVELFLQLIYEPDAFDGQLDGETDAPLREKLIRPYMKNILSDIAEDNYYGVRPDPLADDNLARYCAMYPLFGRDMVAWASPEKAEKVYRHTADVIRLLMADKQDDKDEQVAEDKTWDMVDRTAI